MGTNEIDVHGLLTPSSATTAKRLRGKYRRMADEFGVSVSCEDCQRSPLVPDRLVAVFPRPWSDGPRLQCSSCWANEAAAHTELDEAQAEVGAAKYSGFTPPEIASAAGVYEADVEDALQELNEMAWSHGDQGPTGEVLAALLDR